MAICCRLHCHCGINPNLLIHLQPMVIEKQTDNFEKNLGEYDFCEKPIKDNQKVEMYMLSGYLNSEETNKNKVENIILAKSRFEDMSFDEIDSEDKN